MYLYKLYIFKNYIKIVACKRRQAKKTRDGKNDNVKEDTLTHANLQDCRSWWYLHRFVVDEELDQFLLRLAGRRMETDSVVSSTCQTGGPYDR